MIPNTMVPRKRIRPVAVIPTLFTLGNLWCGFFAIAVTARVPKPSVGAEPAAEIDQLGNIALAAGLIFLAMLFDALDGYLARLAKAPSGFGAQLDSLADLVTFGVAPAYLLVKMCPEVTLWNKFSVWVIAGTFLTCVALRLARFNIETGEEDDHREFKGLPSPAGAAAIASYAFLFWGLRDNHSHLPFASTLADVAEWCLPAFALVVAGLMVSRVRYPHLVSHFLAGERSFQHVVALVFAAVLIAMFRWYSVPILCTLFALYGPARYAWAQVMHREKAHEEPLF
jgi:CDP-diacylglycerol--serine O-phosphatidyltransferase